ncbi:DUF493 domain-containing protein [Malaciobacter mytili]|uniref:HP0495 family protein n=1 Tax=Malaciobacter mytili TaxID=603050 RepID=UPI003BB21B19
MIDLSKETLELNYPCTWIYKLVCHHEKDIKEIVVDVLKTREHSVKESKTSSKGKYKSYSLELLVHNEDDRKELYKLLSDHEHIKMII